MADLILHPVDAVHIGIETSDSIAAELSDAFAFEVEGARHIPSVKARHWDGRIKLYNRITSRIYRGLSQRIERWADESGYQCESRLGTPPSVTQEQTYKFTQDLALTKTPRTYQYRALHWGMNHRRGVLISPTGSGKSLLLHCLAHLTEKPVLIIVPTIGLVDQMAKDFQSYGPCDISKIRGGLAKVAGSHITVSTWQSLLELDREWFEQFDMVLGDECHLYTAKSLKYILESCTETTWRFGVTGTLRNTKTHEWVLEGLFGPIHRVTRTVTLQKQGHLAPIRITQVVLQWTPTTTPTLTDYPHPLPKMKFQEEFSYVVQHPARNTFLTRLITSRPVDENVLALCTFVDKHGRILYDQVQSSTTDLARVLYIVGKTPADERQLIQSTLESGPGHTLIASYGTCSTGINITRLNTIVFGAPAKSLYRVLQSIGRGLRKHATKTHLNVFDIVDDWRLFGFENYGWKHGLVRQQYYADEQFPLTIRTVSFPV